MSDGWGHDPAFVRSLQPALSAVREGLWRLRALGTEHVPADGAALLVAGHDGPRPMEPLVVAAALHRAGLRHPRSLVPGSAFELPFVAPALRRFGGVPAQPPDALGLLAEGHLVLIVATDRHDSGFAEIALRAAVPIVPVAVTSHPWLPAPGPLAALPRASRLRVCFGAPLSPPTADPEDRAAVLDLADAVRARIADGVHANLVHRGGSA